LAGIDDTFDAPLPVPSRADSSRSDNDSAATSDPTVPLDHRTLPGDTSGGSPAENHDIYDSGEAPRYGAAGNDRPGEGHFPEEPDYLLAPAEGFPEAAPPSQGLGRWLRSLIGVDEGLLDRVWEERARYTCLGAIVLGTAAMAALSMLDALDHIFGPIWPALILIALFWGAFICGIDRWLIASTHGVRGGRWRIFAPRILLALLFGMIIATPLVLTVFGSEVVSQAQHDQSNALLAYESELKQCNPLPGAPAQARAAAQSSHCAQFHVPVSDPVIGTGEAIASEQSQGKQLSDAINADNNKIAKLNTIARDECNGVKGTGLSGLVGVGPNCTRDRQKADSFARTSDVAQLQSQVTRLDEKIASQTITAKQQTQQYATNISTAVAKLVATRKQEEGRIGLLNRIDALGELAAAHFVIAAATVLLGLFIIAVDCLPVLSKMMSGTTRYDRILEFRLRGAERMAAAAMKVSERQATSRDEIELSRIESRMSAELERIDKASRFGRARRDAEFGQQLAYLAAGYRRPADV
jgi:pyruvate/2-oxoglutarate dehydrogenase complex dihydrolipoamide acyltransferase (E2) component